MLCLLVSQNDAITVEIKEFCNAHNIAAAVYRLPLKALDNLVELTPDIVIINAVDFPRHWKIVVQHLNSTANEKIKTVLVVGENFSPSDAKKAEFLKVNLFLHTDANSKIKDAANLATLLTFTKKQNTEATATGEKLCVSFSVLNPANHENIAGDILAISPEQIRLKLQQSNVHRGLKAGCTLPNAHLAIAQNKFTPTCRLEEFSENEALFSLQWRSKLEKQFFANLLLKTIYNKA